MSEPRIRHRPLPDRRPHRLGGLDGGFGQHQQPGEPVNDVQCGSHGVAPFWPAGGVAAAPLRRLIANINTYSDTANRPASIASRRFLGR